MRTSELRGWLDRMETAPVPEPDPAFVARLEAHLRAMDQVPEAEPLRQTPVHGRRRRLLVAAGPVAALTAAAAAAAVTLLPPEHHPREVNTADPGVTAPAPEPPVTEPPPAGPTPTTVAASAPWLPAGGTPPTAPPTTAAGRITPVVPVTGVGEHTVTTSPPPAPTSPTTAPPEATTTTKPPAPETLSLHCTAGMSGGTPTVFCGWSQSASSTFRWYRLWRESAGSPPAVVYQSDNRSTTGYYDHTVQTGTNYYYKVDVTDEAGNVIGRSDVATVACC